MTNLKKLPILIFLETIPIIYRTRLFFRLLGWLLPKELNEKLLLLVIVDCVNTFGAAPSPKANNFVACGCAGVAGAPLPRAKGD